MSTVNESEILAFRFGNFRILNLSKFFKQLSSFISPVGLSFSIFNIFIVVIRRVNVISYAFNVEFSLHYVRCFPKSKVELLKRLKIEMRWTFLGGLEKDVWRSNCIQNDNNDVLSGLVIFFCIFHDL